MKSVLLHINRDNGQEARLQAALDIVRAFDSHLTCLQVTPFETFVPADPYGVSHLLQQTYDQIRKEEASEREAVEQRLKTEGASWDWHCHRGAPARLLAEHSWLQDLVIVSSPAEDWPVRLESPPTAADLVVHSRAPVLVVPDDTRSFDCTGTAMVAWDGSAEACQALRGALPLLKRSASVLLAIVSKEGGQQFPPTEAASYLSRNDVGSEIVELPSDGKRVADILRSVAGAREAAYCVMGAFGHSRLRERLMGGVTRDMLSDGTLPLVLAH